MNSEENYLEYANKLFLNGKLQLALHILDHVRNLFQEGKLQLALHILDVIIKGTDLNNVEFLIESLNLKIKILKKKAQDEPSFIAANILNNGALEIKGKIKELKKKLRK